MQNQHPKRKIRNQKSDKSRTFKYSKNRKIKNKERIENKNFQVDILKGEYKIINSDKSRTRPLQSPKGSWTLTPVQVRPSRSKAAVNR